MYAAIVFLPIIGSIIAGLFGRMIGARASEIVTTGLLFVSAALSIVAFNDVALEGHKYITQIMPWIHSGDFAADWTIRVDGITAVMLVVVTGVSSPGASLFHWLHGRGPAPAALLLLSLAFHLRHADAGDGQQFPPALLRLGRRGFGVLPSDRLLVYAAFRQCRRDQGLCGQPGGRFRFRSGHLRHLCRVQDPGFRRGVPSGARLCP